MAVKRTSEIVTIGFEIDESAANTFTESTIDVQLSPLDREVLVIYSVDLDVGTPSGVPGTTTQATMAVCATSQDTMPTIGSTNCLGRVQSKIVSGGPGDSVGFMHTSPDSPTASNLDYIGLVATSDIFVQIQGANNTGPLNGAGKLYCARAQVDAATYAALVQSQALSA